MVYSVYDAAKFVCATACYCMKGEAAYEMVKTAERVPHIILLKSTPTNNHDMKDDSRQGQRWTYRKQNKYSCDDYQLPTLPTEGLQPTGKNTQE